MSDFREFLAGSAQMPPPPLSRQILGTVQADLNPRVAMVFLKVALVHFFAGLSTLLVCPQFGVNLLGGAGIMGILARFGDNACMFGCGAVLLGTSALASAFVLRAEEVKLVKRHPFGYLAPLSVMALAAFYCIGADVFAGLTLAWLVGALIGGRAFFELGLRLRHA